MDPPLVIFQEGGWYGKALPFQYISVKPTNHDTKHISTLFVWVTILPQAAQEEDSQEKKDEKHIVTHSTPTDTVKYQFVSFGHSKFVQ